MSELEPDRTLSILLADVRRVLALLDDNTTIAELRRRRFQNGLWAVMVFGNGQEWVILWEGSDENPDEVVIRYLGPPPRG